MNLLAISRKEITRYTVGNYYFFFGILLENDPAPIPLIPGKLTAIAVIDFDTKLFGKETYIAKKISSGAVSSLR